MGDAMGNPLADPMFAPRVKAILGPTNTGKTHLAIERLLAHASGIIGFPLRLLARENYDRMVARKGARHVALITGEEKIIPPDARWFSCTVEAMPLDRAAEFVAVDEIQLCADPDRGHVFTDRLLHARGLVETMFLGAETIRPLLHRLVPYAEIETRPRLSQITYAGAAKLTRLPPRSAVVAFSAGEVYAIAEWLRRRRGGCAVVMGRLSPRTRNAQVALYQDKEVDFLVATDAIGMGLNMDVNHVAFASLTKFDGHRPRRLRAAELAQIAGRAGRGMRDGTFGTTGTCPAIPEEIVDAVEAHRFDPLEQLCWRNSELDFSGLDPLLASLMAAPVLPGLVRGNDASDLDTLALLSRDAEIRDLSRGGRALHVLWDACQIPDFRKLADESHARLCARVFAHVVRDGGLPEDWLESSFDGLGRTEGDIDTLMARLAGVRVWSYIAARPDWVRDAAHWQARARAIEDSISDVLHERLTARFVDRRAAHLMRRLEAGEVETLLSAVTRRGEVVVEGHPVGQVDGFLFAPDPLAEGEARKLVLRAARRALREEMPRRVAALEAAPAASFGFAPDGKIAWDGAPVARLRPGAGLLHPRAEVLDSEFLDGAQRERIRRRLQAWLDALIRAEFAPLFAAAAAAQAEPGLRGLLHRLTEAAGVAPHEAGDGLDEESLSAELRARLSSWGVRAGRLGLFLPALLKPQAAALRARLWAVREGAKLPSAAPHAAVSIPPPADWPEDFCAFAGWVLAGPLLVRLDIAERLAGELATLTRSGPTALPATLASRLAVGRELLPAVLRGLGFRLAPAAVLAPDAYGPPAPPMIFALRRAPRGRAAAAARRDRPAPHPRPAAAGPFAALAAWQPGTARGRAGRGGR
jgi:ATP-dependent RNA helicase SUPV3L1/SUV3